MSDSDSDVTTIEEGRESSQDKDSKLSANQRAVVKKGVPVKRSTSVHDISDSGSGEDDSSSQEISQSLLTREHEKCLDKKHLQFGSKGDSSISLTLTDSRGSLANVWLKSCHFFFSSYATPHQIVWTWMRLACLTL